MHLTDNLYLDERLTLIKTFRGSDGKNHEKILGYYSSLKPAVDRAISVMAAESIQSQKVMEAQDLLIEIKIMYENMIHIAEEIQKLYG